MTETTTHSPPAFLGEAGAAYWQSVTEAYSLEDHHRQILETACRALDVAAAARAILDAEGLVSLDRFGQQREHPACGTERQAHALFLRAANQLGLDVERPGAR